MALTKVTSGLISADASSVDLNIDAGTLYIDATNNRVGIGTTSPSFPVHVVGSSTNYVMSETTGTSTSAGFRLKGDASADFTLFTTQGTNQFAIYDNANTAQRLTIDSSGNVGIGTSSPARSPLHLATSGTNYCQVHMTNGTSGSTSSDGLTLFTNGTDAGLMQRENSYLLFGTNDTERMRITSSGNVGIGTSSPASGVGVPLTLTSTSTGYVGLRLNGTGSYTNDWDLYASGDGAGLDYFGIYDRTNLAYRMVVTNTGNVGIGTSSPQKTLDVTGSLAISNSTTSYWDFDRNNTTGDLYVADTGTDRIVITTAGDVQLGNSLGNSFYNGVINAVANKGSGAIIKTRNGDGNDHIHLIGDSNIKYGALGLSTSVGSADAVLEANLNLRFNTGGTNERMRIDSSGNFLVGTTSSSDWTTDSGFRVHNPGTAGQYVTISNTSATNSAEVLLIHRVATVSGGEAIQFYRAGSPVGSITVSSGATAYNTSSDYRLKTNIQPMENGLERVKKLNPVSYRWIEEDDGIHEGFIAHEAQEIFSDAIVGEKDGKKMQGMDYGRITPLLVKAIQEQQTLIEQLQAEVALLKGE